MKPITVFTPTYNRKHTLSRTYKSLCQQTNKDFCWLVIDDGSIDGTQEWIESLGPKVKTSGFSYDSMGIRQQEVSDLHFFLATEFFEIEYIRKPNGGLYTGYNVAYDLIQTELNICVDSDDFMPDDAIERILSHWSKFGSNEYSGILGLDYDINHKRLIGGPFPENLQEVFFYEIALKHIHRGDTKLVLRTDIMRAVAPQIGFKGEKNFNPIYMILAACDNYPVLVLNANICNVDYQIGLDSMSQAIYKQYVNSPNSFAKLRLLEMGLKHNSLINRIRVTIHYVSSCVLARNSRWLKDSPYKWTTLLLSPIGLLLSLYIIKKSKS